MRILGVDEKRDFFFFFFGFGDARSRIGGYLKRKNKGGIPGRYDK